MGLVERLEAQSAALLPGPDCAIAAFLDTLEGDDLASVEEVLRRKATIKATVLQRGIEREYGQYLPISTIQRHRNGLCKCARKT